MNSAVRIRRLLILLFSLGIASWWLYSQVLQPLPLHVGADPQLAYLMSSLSPFKGEAYTFIDHPGTPVEIFGTLVLALTYPFTRTTQSTFLMMHIRNPRIFLFIVRTLLASMSVLAMIMMAKQLMRVKHWTDGLISASLAVLFFAIYPRAFNSIVTWSHNSFNYPFGALLGLWVLVLFRDYDGGTGKQRGWLGFFMGILIAIQIYFVTWLLGAVLATIVFFLISSEGWKRAISASAQLGFAALGGFVLVTLPIANRYGEFARWISAVITHQGRHGSGPPGFISLQSAVSNLIALTGEARLIFLSILLALLLLIIAAFRRRETAGRDPGLIACAVGFTFQMFVMLGLIIKHPGIIYLQAVAVSLTFVWIVALALLHLDQLRFDKIERLSKFGLSVLVCGLFVLGFIRAVLIHRAEVAHVQAAETEIESYLEMHALAWGDDPGAMTKLWVYGMPSDCQALWYGNRYAHNAFAREIDSLCPNDLNYDLWQEQVVLADGSTAQLGDLSWDILIANEAALIDFPHLSGLGKVIYSDVSLGTFGRIVYILHS